MLVEDVEHGGILLPQFEHYTVTERDRTLGDIASRFYGDKDRWRAIAQANPHRDPARLKAAGLAYPHRSGQYPGHPGRRPWQSDRSRSTQPAGVTFTEYVVRTGDTLGAISRMHYGTTQHADAIFAHNRERLGLRSPRAIRPGQVLLIPKEP